MDFEFYFSEQLKNHPSMRHRDAVKLCYQASFGAEHLLSNEERARAYLESEFNLVESTNEPLFERISPDICRVNLGAWKREKRDLKILFEAFKGSAFLRENAKEIFLSYLEIAEKIMESELPDFDKSAWLAFLDEYKMAGMPPIHHSEEYRASEKPSYRIVKITELEKIL